MSAVTDNNSAEESNANKESDEEVTELLDTETYVEFFVVDKDKTRQGGAFFKYLNLAFFNLEKYGLFQTIGRYNYKYNCLY